MEDSLWLTLLGTYLCSVGCNFVMHFRKQLKKISMPNLDHAFQVQDFCSNFVCNYIIIITTHTATFACLRITNYTLKLHHCFLSTKNYGHNEYWFRQACWGTPRLSACQHRDKWKYTILNNMSTSTKIKKTLPKWAFCSYLTSRTSHLLFPVVYYISSYLRPSEPHTEW